uniref:DNA replication regulator SLD2 n=1 Tax=Panagrellus redivivus TaxID=6233 RepID=A0A7E4VJS5_PANRE
MEAWSQAYKAIHGKTPTKKQRETLAPASLLATTDGSKPATRKSPRKSASLKRPASSFASPAKKRRLLDFGGKKASESKPVDFKPSESDENEVPSTSSAKRGRFLDFGKLKKPEALTPDDRPFDKAFEESNTDTFEPSTPEPLEPPTSTSSKPSTDDASFLNSPLKNWPTPMRLRQSPRKTPQKKPPSASLATPSPRKTIAERAAGTSSCRRLHKLLEVKTPVKAEEEEEVEVFENEMPDAKAYKPKDPYARKSKNTNFLALNMRKKNYVKGKPGKFNKKKFMNSKFKKRF